MKIREFPGPSAERFYKLLSPNLDKCLKKMSLDEGTLTTFSKKVTKDEFYLLEVTRYVFNLFTILDHLQQAVFYIGRFPSKAYKLSGITRQNYLQYHRSNYLNGFVRLRDGIAQLVNVWLKIGLRSSDVNWAIIRRTRKVEEYGLDPTLGKIHHLTKGLVKHRHKDVHDVSPIHPTVDQIVLLDQAGSDILPKYRKAYHTRMLSKKLREEMKSEVEEIIKAMEQLWGKMIKDLRKHIPEDE